MIAKVHHLLIIAFFAFSTSETQPELGRKNRVPWSSQHLHQVGDALLEKEEIVSSFLEGVELTASIPPGATTKSLYYLVGNDADFVITVSPCIGPLKGIHFHSIKTIRHRWGVSVSNNWIHRNKSSNDLLTAVRRHYLFHKPVELMSYEVEGDLRHQHRISTGPNWLKGSNSARVHLTLSVKSGDTLITTIYGNPGSTFKVRWTAKRNDLLYQSLQGYPVLPLSTHFDVCRKRYSGIDLLNIEWTRVPNEDSSIQYCVSINRERSLPHRCSLQHLEKNVTAAINAKLIHKCTRDNRLQLLLHSDLSDGQRQLFLSVYAINETSNVSSAYTPRVFSSIPLCGERPATEIIFALRPTTYFVHWSMDIIFNWPRNSKDIAMFLVPCRRSRNKEFLFNLRVFKQKTFEEHEQEVPIEVIRIRNAPILDLSPLSRIFDQIGGKIRLQLSPLMNGYEDLFIKGDKAARIFFLNRTERSPLPIRPRHSGETKLARSDRSIQEVDNDNYPVEFQPICQLHQIRMKMAVSPVPQVYRITTIPISAIKNIPYSEIEKCVNNCENSIDELKKLFGSQSKTDYQRIVGRWNSTTLEVQLPFSYRYDSPRHYFILVYASHVEDVTSAYKTLFFHRILDACHLIEGSCYSSGRCS
ncbi:unnamed protein product [Rodentolepis nana]|uniref:Protein NDNF n=1 Tax=Rodentolepis nana TaxID=102285 RepID=A0A0R3TRR8_RODNA|nr:unnamed protein product [Rodentolepis nana]